MPGNLINPLIVEGQIHGGLAQGIGQAMIEEVVYSEDGQLLTGSFMDYAMPRATDFPRFELDNTVTPTPVNPLGAKGVGEAGTLGSTPEHRRRGGRRAERVRREAHRHDAAAREAVAHHPRRPGVIPTHSSTQRATSLDDALAKLQAAGGDGKFIAGGHSLVPLMKLRLSEPQSADRHRPHSGACPASARRTAQIEIGAGDRASRRRHVGAAPRALPGRRRGGRRDRRSAGAQPRHARRQPGARRSVGRLPGRDAGARRRDPPEGTEGLARGQGERLLPGSLHRRSGSRTRSSRASSSPPCGRRRTPSSISAPRTSRIVGVAAALDVSGGAIRSARIGLTGAGPHAIRLTKVEQALAGSRPRRTPSPRPRRRRAADLSWSTPTSTPARTIAAR